MWWREGTNDWNTLCSCITEDEYAMGAIDAGSVRTMVDIGGYLGGVGIAFAADHPDARVWIVEPLSANVELIERNVAENELGGQVTLLHRAADRPGRKRTTVRWAFGDDESAVHHRFVGNSSISTHAKRHETEPVACIDLAALVALAGGHIDLLKIDCEGAEYDVFRDGKALGDVGRIVGEYHTGEAPLRALLEPTHHVTTTGDGNIGGFTAVPR